MPTVQSQNTGSTSTSSSSRKYKLDQNSKSDIFVYKVRHGAVVSSERELCKELDKNSALRCSRKPIPRGCSRLEVQTQDLFNEPEKTKYAHYPNARSSLASVGLPRSVYWRRLLLGQFPELYIVSPENSPNNSPEESQEESPQEDHGAMMSLEEVEEAER